jgi:hypothetical protein
LWRAVGAPGGDFAWVIAVIGAAPDAADRLVVAPVFGAPGVPTEHDLLLDTELLGYPAFADVANTGTILRGQLTEPLGQLSEPSAKLLSALYRAVLSDGPMPAPKEVGVPVTSSDDPRLLAADERRDALRQLWRAADELVDADDKGGEDDAALTSGSTVELALPVILAGYLEGPRAEWDRSSLLERSGADGAFLDAFRNNKLDLTDQADIGDLAKIIHVLEIPWEQAEPAVVRTLLASPGGARHATRSADLPLAARGASGASDKDIAGALKHSHSRVDDTDAARRQQVASYIAELRKLLDELD